MKLGSVSLAALIAAAAGTFWVEQASARAPSGPSPNTSTREDSEEFNRSRNTSVRTRNRPEYDAVGIRWGTFRFFPEVLLAVEHDDNIFATNTAEESDVIFHVAPKLEWRSMWSNHLLNFAIEAPSQFYSEFDNQNATSVVGSFNGRLDVYRDFSFFSDGSYGTYLEPLQTTPSPLSLESPIEYLRAAGMVGFSKTFNRLRVSAQSSLEDYDFEDGTSVINTPIEQDDRDRTILSYGARADYAISPMTSLFVSATANERDYDLGPPDTLLERDSEGYEVLVGANFDISRLVRGEIGAGYLSQEYDDPLVEESTGLAVRGRVEWFPDELVTISLAGGREVQDAGAFDATSYIANNASVAIDYEFRRNIILGIAADYSVDDYVGVDREDTRWDAVAKVDYSMNRGVSLWLELGHYTQSSEGLVPGREYDINRALIGVKLRR